jgi:hypothetical protein
MKQILQNLKSGATCLTEVPAPQVGRGSVLIQTRASLVSAGTERMLVEFSQGNLLQKARSQPEKVKQVLDKMRTDGLLPTIFYGSCECSGHRQGHAVRYCQHTGGYDGHGNGEHRDRCRGSQLLRAGSRGRQK